MFKQRQDQVLQTHRFCFSENDDGEGLTLTTKFIGNGDPGGVFANQEMSLQSYCNSASINLFGIFLSPKSLRKLADELEATEAKARTMAM